MKPIKKTFHLWSVLAPIHTQKPVRLMKHGFVKLKMLDRIIHFGPALVPAYVFLGIILFAAKKGIINLELLTITGTMFLIPAAILYVFQKSKLEFQCIKTTITRDGFKDLVKEISSEYRWAVHSHLGDEFTLKTNPGPINQVWGQLITIKYTPDGILLNSIFDTNKGVWLITFGNNSRNINNITRIIEQRTAVL